MYADVDRFRLTIEREPDHWAMSVRDLVSGAYLYRAQSTNTHCGRCVLLEFVSCELGKRINDEDVAWIDEGCKATTTQLKILDATKF